jgi:hypothetical protein
MPSSVNLEFTDLQVNGYKRPQTAVIEQQVNVIVPAVNGDPLLARKKSKVCAQDTAICRMVKL